MTLPTNLSVEGLLDAAKTSMTNVDREINKLKTSSNVYDQGRAVKNIVMEQQDFLRSIFTIIKGAVQHEQGS